MMKLDSKLLIVTLLLLLGGLLTVKGSKSYIIEKETLGSEQVRVLVTKVIDGDTLEVESGGIIKKVRLIGINTPETVDPRKGVECFGKEASREAKDLLEGKYISMSKDVSEKDKYGRLLRYIYLGLEDGVTLFVNDYLIREGFAYAYNFPPDVKFNNRFLDAQKQAQERKRGLWSVCQNK